MQGPAIFLAQFLSDKAPFNTLSNISRWAAGLGFRGMQLPSWDNRVINLDIAADSKSYCEDLKASCNGLQITELAAHLQGQLVAVHPAYDELFDGFAPEAVRGNSKARSEWAAEQVKKVIKASGNFELKAIPIFSGALLWPYLYAWPQRAKGLVDQGFKELARRWRPLLDLAAEKGISLAYEIHPSEDLHDGASFERFLAETGEHESACILYDPSHLVLQGMDYVDYIYRYGKRIKAFHVKDAEFRPSGRTGAYGGYLEWKERAGRFRSLGDGQIDFKRIFTALTEVGFNSWAVLEWECCIKDGIQGAKEGAEFIRAMMIEPAQKAFDDFAGTASDTKKNRRILGI